MILLHAHTFVELKYASKLKHGLYTFYLFVIYICLKLKISSFKITLKITYLI